MADAVMIAGLFVTLFAIGALAWLQWTKATPEEREKLVSDMATRLVEDAEALYNRPGAGVTRYGWVMNRLQKRFPDADWDVLGEYIDVAVRRLHERKAALQAGHRGGTNT